MLQADAVQEIHDRVRQCFTRHQFITFGDAVGWLQQEEPEVRDLEAGERGYSKFSTDILWLASIFGPTAEIDHKIMGVHRLPALKPVKICDKPDDEEIRPRKAPRRKTRRRRF
ncbi:MAG: hypothetical protein ACXAC5_01415 [Promethearchaeota archaeon]